MANHPADAGRWQNYHLTRGRRLGQFWSEHLAERRRDALLVTSRGMDPRTGLVPAVLLAAGGEGRRDVLTLVYREGEQERGGDEAAAVAIAKLVDGRGEAKARVVDMYSADGRRVASQRAAEVIADEESLAPYDDIVIDVSGMPRSVFFPLIARVLFLLDNGQQSSGRRNVFVLVAENPALDANIKPRGMEEFAGLIAGFRGSFDQEHFANRPTIWLPLLVEGRGKQLERIYDLVKPEETCPVLPSPARNPRRADDLVRDHRDFLFGQLTLDAREFMFAAEDNPFEVYRQLRAAVLRYEDALSSIGGCRIAFSALSSKLMSLGALLAAYELKQGGTQVAVAHVDSHGYDMEGIEAETELFGLWITGECYEPHEAA